MTDALSALVEDGESLLYDGDYVGARRIFEEAVAQAEAEHGERAKELIVPLMGLARASGENNATACAQMERELEVQRRALAIAESALPGDDPLLAECLHAHGVSVWANGEPARAVELLLRALAIVRRVGGDAHGYLGPLVGRCSTRSARPMRCRMPASCSASRTPARPPISRRCSSSGSASAMRARPQEARVVLERFLVAFGEDGNPTIRDEVRGWLSAPRCAPS